MAGTYFEYRIDNDELIAALAELERRISNSTGHDLTRLCTGVNEMHEDSTDWITSWPDWANGAFHFVPGPKLIDLLMPVERLKLPKAHIQGGRWKRAVRHLRAAWEAVRS
jgi:hypothetical protein